MRTTHFDSHTRGHCRVPIWCGAALSAALLVAGCGSGGSTTGTSAQTLNNPVARAFKFSACMRQHGVANFPDPQVTSSPGQQQITLRLPAGARTSVELAAAQKACRGIMPGPSSTDLAAQAQQEHVHTQGLLGFARCVRRHGINNFPDPDSQGELSPQMVSTAGVDVHAPSVLAAARACISASDGQVTAAAIAHAENAGS